MSAGAGAAGTAMQVIGGLYSGISANRQAGAQAAALEENGRRTILQGELDAQEVRRAERMATGEMIGAQGASGLIGGTGSLAAMIAQNAYNRESDIFNIRRKATGDAASLYDEASQARARGREALIGSAFGAVSTALTGVAKLRSERLTNQQASKERSAALGSGFRQPQAGETGYVDPRDVWVNPFVRVPRMQILNY